MSLNRTRPNEVRLPDFIELPDGRKRLVRYFELPNGLNLTDSLVEAYGTADVGPASGTTAGFANLRLVDQRLVKINEASVYQKTYEELPATAELQVGGATTGNTTIKYPDGRTGYEAEFLQLVAGTYTPGTVGATTAPGDASAYLQREETTCDGMLRRIKRTYVYAGQISQSDETKHYGRLLLRTLTYVKTVPPTPSGYTLISERADPNLGLPIYTYTFAKGDGEISRDTRYGQSSDQGTTGATVITVRHLTASSVGANPIWTPAGTVLISEDKSDQDGYRIWTATYAKGAGTVTTATETKEGGKLIITRKTALGSAPIAPVAALGGTVTLISAQSRESEGYVIYDSTWAEGVGEISREIDYSQSSDQGTTGITRTTIRYLVAPGATVQPTSLAGFVEVGRTVQEVEGYRIWVTVWAKGTGIVVSETTHRYNGDGTIRLVLYHKVALGSAPSAPIATISGTVREISSNSREESGYVVYEKRWAEGNGLISSSVQVRDGGLKLINYVSLGTKQTPTPGIVVADDTDQEDGYPRYSVTVIQGADGTTPTSYSYSYEQYVDFTFPGRAEAYVEAFTVLGVKRYFYDVFLSPPVTCLVKGTVTVSYQTSNAIGTVSDLWNPTEWATVRARFVGWSATPRSVVKALPGYRSVSATPKTFTADGLGANYTIMGERVYASTEASLICSGGPAAPDGNTYTLSARIDPNPVFVSTAGVPYYRKTVIVATIPTQAALPTYDT